MSRYPHPERTLAQAYRAEVKIDPTMPQWVWLGVLTVDDEPIVSSFTLRKPSVRVHYSTASFYRCLPRQGYPVGALDPAARYALVFHWNFWTTTEFGGLYLRLFGGDGQIPPTLRLRPEGIVLDEATVRAQVAARSRVAGQWVQTQLKQPGVFWDAIP